MHSNFQALISKSKDGLNLELKLQNESTLSNFFLRASLHMKYMIDPIDRPLRAFYNIPTSGVVPPLNAKVQALGIRAG